MFPRVARLLGVAAVAVVLAACESTMGTKDGEQQPPVTESQPSGTQPGATSQGVGAGSTFRGHPLDDPASNLSKRTVYFDFDSSTIKDEDRAIVEAHAQYLANNPSAAVTLEGHADERGTREYNIALGERRANSVRQLVTLLGGSVQQVETVSYGEERPAVEGHDDASWQWNRRVEIIYRTR
ncbi:MAG: peptidoglycan-associated lipoprotein Pal [Ectothiorhodospiraceae bacterium]|nr:peptidoglycan-associated lipoprotein Pal [Ectothiorhodospiraceae bacterium]